MSSEKFTLVTIAGRNYTLSLAQAFALFWHHRFALSVLVTYVVLVLLMPHNSSLELSWLERWVFWLVIYGNYLLNWFVFLYLGARWAIKTGRSYYTPIGMFVAAVFATFLMHYLASLMHGEIYVPNQFIIIEILINALFISIFEAIFFFMNVPKIAEEHAERADHHEWEDLED